MRGVFASFVNSVAVMPEESPDISFQRSLHHDSEQGSIAIVERVMLTLKDEWFRRIVVPTVRDHRDAARRGAIHHVVLPAQL